MIIGEAFESVGVYYIGSDSTWKAGSIRNTYRGTSGKYLTYKESIGHWVIGNLNVPQINEHAGNDWEDLGSSGLLPESYGSYVIDNRLGLIDPSAFVESEPVFTIDPTTETVTISFQGTLQTGFIKL